MLYNAHNLYYQLLGQRQTRRGSTHGSTRRSAGDVLVGDLDLLGVALGPLVDQVDDDELGVRVLLLEDVVVDDDLGGLVLFLGNDDLGRLVLRETSFASKLFRDML